MRMVLIVLVLALVACSPAPRPTSSAASPGPTRRPTSSVALHPTTAAVTFVFDVDNRSRLPIVVSVASDAAATMPGFEAGQRGTVSLGLLSRENGIAVEVLAPPDCGVLAAGFFPTPERYTLLVEDGSTPTQLTLSTRSTASSGTIPLPSNSLSCPGG